MLVYQRVSPQPKVAMTPRIGWRDVETKMHNGRIMPDTQEFWSSSKKDQENIEDVSRTDLVNACSSRRHCLIWAPMFLKIYPHMDEHFIFISPAYQYFLTCRSQETRPAPDITCTDLGQKKTDVQKPIKKPSLGFLSDPRSTDQWLALAEFWFPFPLASFRTPS